MAMQPLKHAGIVCGVVACFFVAFQTHLEGFDTVVEAPRYLQQSMAISCPAKKTTNHPWATSCGHRIIAPHLGRRHRVGCVAMGTSYGGYEMPDPLCFLNPGDVYYGFGVGEDMSYDLAMLASYNLTVRIFDPTPRATDHVEAVKMAIARAEGPLPGKSSSTYEFKGQPREISGNYPAQAYFDNAIKVGADALDITYRPWALSTKDGAMQFTQPKSGVSHSLGGGKDALSVTVRSLPSIMAEFGDERVSILKMDIEGHEVNVIPQLAGMWKAMPKDSWPRVLVLDMDSVRDGHPNKDMQKGKACIALLKDMGYIEFSSNNFDFVYVLEIR